MDCIAPRRFTSRVQGLDLLVKLTVVEHILKEIASRGADGVWISVVSREDALARARHLEALSRREREALAAIARTLEPRGSLARTEEIVIDVPSRALDLGGATYVLQADGAVKLGNRFAQGVWGDADGGGQG